jgi:hypothetical protein
VTPRQQATPLRVAFVGQSVFFRQCALEQAADGLEPTFLDFRTGAPPQPLLEKLEALDPDVVLVFRPEIIPPDLFDSVRATTIGYLTEPLPRDGARQHRDLRQRLYWLGHVDPDNFDRVISFDPLIAETAASVLPVWRSVALPVADSIFMDVRERADPPRLLFVGRPTEHRDTLLGPIKEAYPIVHVGHGLFGEQLQGFLADADVQLNLHNHDYPSFENRVCIAMAAGNLVISEPLSPTHGLGAGHHYLEARTPQELLALIGELWRDPDAYAEVQAAGRREAERFRASRVYPDLVRDALADVASGPRRRGS